MNNISVFREKVGVTQKQLAEKIGWSQPRIANYESGFRVPSLKDSRKIISGLNAFGAKATIDKVFPVGNI